MYSENLVKQQESRLFQFVWLTLSTSLGYNPGASVRDGVMATHTALDRGIKVRPLVPQPIPFVTAPSSSGLGRVVLSHQTGVRFP